MSFRREKVELVELEVSENSPFANTYVQDIDAAVGGSPRHRAGGPRCWRAAATGSSCPTTTCSAYSPGKEKDLIKVFLPEEEPERVQFESELDTSEG